MSGGRLVVLDRLGREVKRYPLLSGLATLGSDPRCDIRVMLPAVSGHHATVVVHTNQTVVRNVGDGETLVNGVAVSVAALRHGDLVSVGDRSLRWEYADPAGRREPLSQAALYVPGRTARRGRRRGSGAAAGPARSPALRLALEMQHRASMPGNAGGKQVAIVQPQRRDTTEQNEQSGRPSPSGKRQRASKADGDGSPRAQQATMAELWIASRKPTPRPSPRRPAPLTPAPTVQSGRKPAASAKKSTPLRLQVLRRAQSAHKARVTKIEAPTVIDHTKQAAIMLMTGHTPKSKLPSPRTSTGRKTPSYVIKKPSPVRRTPRNSRGSKTPRNSTSKTSTTPKASVTPKKSVTPKSVSPKLSVTRNSSVGRKSSVAKKSVTPEASLAPQSPSSAGGRRSSKRASGSHTVSFSDTPSSTRRSRSAPPASPRKSSLKDPARRPSRKRDSIKFDLSNLEPQRRPDVEEYTLGDTTDGTIDSITEDDLTLRYSDTSSVHSPSPRQSIHSRSSRMLEKSLGASPTLPRTSRSTLTAVSPDSPRRKSSRGSLIIQRALDSSNSRYSRRTTKTLTDHSYDTTVASAFKTRTLSPRSPNNLETYSIVDLVSIDSNESSVYNSAGSTNSSAIAFGTPQNSSGRKTRSTIDPSTLIGSSTPYVAKTRNSSRNSSKSSADSRKSSRSSNASKRSQSLTTPDNVQKHVSVNSTRVSRPSKSRSRLNESDLMLISLSDSSQLEDESPRSSRRVSRNQSNQASPAVTRKSTSNKFSPVIDRSAKSNTASPVLTRATRSNPVSPIISRTSKSNQASPVIGRKTKSKQPSPNQAPKRKSSRRSGGETPSSNEGMSTPENRHSPQEVGTPVLNIRSLLNSSQSSLTSSASRRGRPPANIKRKTIGALRSGPKARAGAKSKSLNFTARKGVLRMSKDSSAGSDRTDEGAARPPDDEMVTPTSAVKLVQEAVKNKHSTAKKPQSKRSIIDNLNESDIVKQLFNSPVKRKLSQSMTEFSRRQLFEDDDGPPRRPTRNTIAVAGRTPDNSILNNSEAFTPERFVSPISTPGHSPNMTGIKRLFRKDTPENDLRNVRGVKTLLKTPRTRRSIRNDLTNVSGVKRVFAKSPKNRLSDVRVKEVFVASPKNDLRRVSGVKSLFQSQERKSPRNDLSDVRGVRNMFKSKSPANDLRRVSGVKQAMRKNSPRNDLSDVRGVRRMFRQERARADLMDVSGVEELFNESHHSARDSESLFDQLIGKPPIKAVYSKSFVAKSTRKGKGRGVKSLHASVDEITNNVEDWLERELQRRLLKDDSKSSRANASRELQKLATDTVAGGAPLRAARGRSGAAPSEVYGAHTLPLKKRSLVDSTDKTDRSRARGRSSLPLKKRAVAHSTPVKGRGRAATLGRVSPIARDADQGNELSTLSIPDFNDAKGKRVSRITIEVNKPSPRPTRSSPKAKTSLNRTKPSPRTSKSPKTAKASPRTKKSTVQTTKPSVQSTNTSPKTSKSSPRTTKTSPRTAKSPKTTKSSPRTTIKSPRTTERSPRTNKPSPRTTQPSPRITKTTKPSPKATKPSPKTNKPSPKTTKPSPKTNKAVTKKTVASPKDIASQSKESITQPRSTRARGNKTDTPQRTKKGRASLVIAKKSPVMSPKPAPRSRRGKGKDVAKVAPVQSPKASPKKTRTTRKQEEKPATPKRNTRAKVQKASVVVGKPSPQLKPQAKTRGKAQSEPIVEEAPKTRTKRESKAKVSAEAPRKSRKTAASEKTTEEVESRSKRRKVESPKQSPKKSRRTKQAEVVEVVLEPKGRRNKANVSKEVPKSPEKRRGRKIEAVVEKVEPKRNTRKTQVKEDAKATTAAAAKKTGSAQPKGTRSRKQLEPQTSTQSEPVRGRRARAADDTVIPELNTRKRKSTAEDVVPTKMSKTVETKAKKGRKVTPEPTEAPTSRQKRLAPRDGGAAAGAGAAAAAPPKPSRTRKEAAEETVPRTSSRNEKTAAAPTPVKRAAIKKSPAKTPPAKRTRGKPEPVVVATKAGRSRRR